jgi:hypothetical protein
MVGIGISSLQYLGVTREVIRFPTPMEGDGHI